MRRGILMVPLLALALAGCTATAQQAASTKHPQLLTAPATPTSSPTLTSPPTAASSPVPSPLAPAPPASVTVVPNEYLADADLTNVIYRVEVPSADGGPRQYAEGTAILEGSKVVAYKVASGDLYDFIAKRFGLSNDGYILAVNSIRRGGNALLYAGDVLNLSADTMHKYGSINGRVLNNPEPSPMPQQEP